MRALSLADVDEVLAIEQAVQAYPWTRGNFTDSLANGYIGCVDEDGGSIRGYAILMPVADEAELLNIGVAKEWQRRGSGRMLLEEVFQIARSRNMKRVYLEVRPSNVAAIALYRRAGFSEIGVRRGYYRNGDRSEDALLMSCDISTLSPCGESGARGAKPEGGEG